MAIMVTDMGNAYSSTDAQIFLQRESAEDALDFWLDAQQHENLCKAYFKVRPPSSILSKM
jgi:hypothetical protein